MRLYKTQYEWSIDRELLLSVDVVLDWSQGGSRSLFFFLIQVFCCLSLLQHLSVQYSYYPKAQ